MDFPVPKRTTIQVLGADAPKKQTIGWTMYENVGVGVYNPRTMAPPDFVVFDVPFGPKGHGLRGHVFEGSLRFTVIGDVVNVRVAEVSPATAARFARGESLVALLVAQRVVSMLEGHPELTPDDLEWIYGLVADALRAAVVHGVVTS